MKVYHPQDAWQAHLAEDYSRAAEIWLALMNAARDIQSLSRYQLGYAQVLIARQQYDEARGLLEEVYEATAHPECLRLIELSANRRHQELEARIQSLLAAALSDSQPTLQPNVFKEQP